MSQILVLDGFLDMSGLEEVDSTVERGFSARVDLEDLLKRCLSEVFRSGLSCHENGLSPL